VAEGFPNPYQETHVPSKGEKQIEYANEINMLLQLVGWTFTPNEVEALGKVIGAAWREWNKK
jgi:hypothetical protein